MAQIKDVDKNKIIKLEPLRFENKSEGWFFVVLKIYEGNSCIKKIDINLHQNDFVHLIKGLKTYTSTQKRKFEFKPIEPNILIEVNSIGDKNFLNLYYCEGPIYTPSNYTRYKLVTTNSQLEKFSHNLFNDLKEIDSNIKLELLSL